MEVQHEAYDDRKLMESLDVQPFLENFNKSLLTKYKSEVEARMHRVYELSELDDLAKEPSLSDSDKVFVSWLQRIKNPSDRAQELLNGIENFFNASINQGSSDVLNTSEPRAKLRRTAAILYKNAQIPMLGISRGAFKEVSGPIGVGKEYSRETTRAIIEKIGPVWKWDGNLPDLSTNKIEKTSQEQMVFIANNPDSKDPQDLVTSMISDELEIVDLLNDALDNPSYLPRIYQKTKNGRYVESIPLGYPSGSFETRIKDAIQIANDFKEIWKVAGIILTDTKASNFRKRDNGEVVITDLGGRFIGNPGMAEFDSRKLGDIDDVNHKYVIDHTPIYTPPEFTEILSGVVIDKIKAEPFLVYQLGILLLQSMYDSHEVNQSLRDKKGKRWIDRSGDFSELRYSINSDTVVDLSERYTDKQIPLVVNQILTLMLNDNPDNRPSIDQVIKALENSLLPKA